MLLGLSAAGLPGIEPDFRDGSHGGINRPPCFVEVGKAVLPGGGARRHRAASLQFGEMPHGEREGCGGIGSAGSFGDNSRCHVECRPFVERGFGEHLPQFPFQFDPAQPEPQRVLAGCLFLPKPSRLDAVGTGSDESREFVGPQNGDLEAFDLAMQRSGAVQGPAEAGDPLIGFGDHGGSALGEDLEEGVAGGDQTCCLVSDISLGGVGAVQVSQRGLQPLQALDG